MILSEPYFDKYRHTILNLVALCILILFSIPDIYATHVAGGNMTYRCLDNNQFEITLEFRRDCLNGAPGAQFDDPASIGIFDSAGNLLTSLGNNGELRIPFSSTDTLNEVLTTECSMVNSDICIHRTTYLDTVMLPNRVGGYILSYQRCCRNFTLNNIVDPLATGSTYWIHISDTAMSLCNNSPKFKKWPDIFICKDDTLRFDHGATDADGDSLVYELCVPSLGANQDFPRPQPPNNPPYNTISWNAGYGLEDMMGGDPLTIDPITGKLYAVPSTTGQFLIGICVKEYRDGVLLSEVRRDFEYNVRACVDSPMAVFEPSHYIRCDRLDIAFTNSSNSDLVPFEDLDFIWYFDYPDDMLKSTQTNPNIKFPAPGLYTVALVVYDGTCRDTAFAQIGVSVPDDPTANFTLNSTICNGQTEIQLIDSSMTTQDVLEYNWTIAANNTIYQLSGPNPVLEIGNDQAIEVSLEIITESGCSDMLTQTFNIQTEITVGDIDLGPDQQICEGESITLTASDEFESYLWNTGSTDKIIVANTSGMYSVTAIDSCGHSASDTMFLEVNPTEITSLNYEICSDEFITLNGITYDVAGNYSQTLSTQFGCDSILSIALIVHEPQTTEVSYAFCLRHGIIVQGTMYDTTGQFVQPYTDEFGCEGTLIVNLTAEEDCDYCGTTLEVNRYQITIRKHDTDSFEVSIFLKEQILLKEIVGALALEKIVADYVVKKEIVNRARPFVFASYKSGKTQTNWNHSDRFTEKNVINYFDQHHIHDFVPDVRSIDFSYRYILNGIDNLERGNSFSFK